MSNSQDYQVKNHKWVWYSFIPAFGGLAISYAGNKTNNNKWIWYGVGFVASSILLGSAELIAIIWLAQVGTAFYLKKNYLATSSSERYMINLNGIRRIAKNREKIDINSCSQDELVHKLGLPIVYANDLKSLAEEGYIFTHLEELSEVAGIPESYLKQIEPLITFHYNIHKESDVSWRRINSFSIDELVACNIEAAVAEKIVNERNKGTYKSLIDVRKRTGIPLNSYKHLL